MDATAQRDSRDDGMPPECARIEVQVGEVRQLFVLYDWWPILGEARLFDRPSAMRMQVVNE